MTLRVGVDIVSTRRVAQTVQRFPARISRLLRDDERGGDLNDAALFAAKEAVVKAVGRLSIFDGAAFAITRVRGGLAAIPRNSKFEERLVEAGLSWVSVCCGELFDHAWSVAVALPGRVPAFDAVLSVRQVAHVMIEPDRLDSDTLRRVMARPNPQLSRAARQTAVRAASILLEDMLEQAGIDSRDDDSLYFTQPKRLCDLPLSIAHDGHFVAAVVARHARGIRLRLDKGSAIERFDIL